MHVATPSMDILPAPIKEPEMVKLSIEFFIFTALEKSMIRNLLFLSFALLATSLFAQVPPAEDLRLYDIGASTSAERIQQDVTRLVGFDTRHSLSDTRSETTGIGAARRWIKAEFESISKQCGGCLEVLTIADTVSGKRIPDPHEIVSVIAIQRGQHDPNRMVLMSGDIDSRVSDPMDSTSTSPGANDNASGMAGVIEAARVLSRYTFQRVLSMPGWPAKSRVCLAERSSLRMPGEKAGISMRC